MGHRIGIDVGGTFTDFIFGARRPRGRAHQGADHAAGPVARRDERDRRDRRRAKGVGVRALLERDGPDRPRHHHRRQHDDRDERRGDGADHHRRATATRSRSGAATRRASGIRPSRRRSRSRRAAAASACPSGSTSAARVVTPLDEAAVRHAVQRLRKQGVESIAVCLLFSFINPAHEKRVREIIARGVPGRARLALARGDADGAGVRAHLDHAGRRLRRPARRELPEAPAGRAARRGLRRTIC